MIKPKCRICKSELDEFGAILLSPSINELVTKEHICVECFALLERIIEDLMRFSKR